MQKMPWQSIEKSYKTTNYTKKDIEQSAEHSKIKTFWNETKKIYY